MSKEENVLRYYLLCNKLKNVIRTGWKDWNVKAERLESVAEHIYGVQMLALAMNSEFHYDINIMKVLYMLAVHELEEIYIGDLTLFQISSSQKKLLGHEAVSKVLGNLIKKEEIQEIIEEFDARTTKEAKFAYHCDKLECDLQSKIYDERNLVDLNDQQDNKTFYDERVQKFLKEGKSFSDMWLLFGQSLYSYDENFTAVSNYARKNDILKLI